MHPSLRPLLFLGLATLLTCAAPRKADTASLPDLWLSSYGYELRPDGPKIFIRCSNRGDGGSGTFRVHVRSLWDGSYHTVINFTALPLAAHSYHDYYCNMPPYPMKYLMFFIDAEHWVAESDETNNVEYFTL